MFRAIISPILRSTILCVYSVWYNALTMLSAGSLDEVELLFSMYRNLISWLNLKCVAALKVLHCQLLPLI
jgi:predicted MPP superfamily phosphohydrolase